MNRYALLAPVIAIAAICFACTQPFPPPPAPSPPKPVAANCSFNANGVGVLSPTYFPDPTSNSYSPPGNNLQPGVLLSNQMIADIDAAFANAPLSVQNDICALSGIFIDTSSCQGGTINPCNNNNEFPIPISWGYRSWVKKNSDVGNMYIAIPATLWPVANTTATAFSQYEQNVVQYFAKTANPNWGTLYPLPTISGVSYNNSNPNNLPSSWPTVLVALVHELGHAKFNYTIHPKDNYGKDYKFDPLTMCNVNINGSNITIDFFSGWSYNGTAKKLVPKDFWRQFSYQDNEYSNNKIEHSMSPYLSDFQDQKQNPNDLLYTLYSGASQPWPSFWGAWSPDEDFVETYVLYALKANVTSLQISISGYSPYDVITGSANKQTLSNKMQCLADLPTL